MLRDQWSVVIEPSTGTVYVDYGARLPEFEGHWDEWTRQAEAEVAEWGAAEWGAFRQCRAYAAGLLMRIPYAAEEITGEAGGLAGWRCDAWNMTDARGLFELLGDGPGYSLERERASVADLRTLRDQLEAWIVQTMTAELGAQEPPWALEHQDAAAANEAVTS